MRQVFELLDKEIQWCKANPDPSLTEEYQQGFVAGIQQAKLILDTWAKVTRTGVAGTNLTRDEIRFMGLDLDIDKSALRRFADCWESSKKKKEH